MKSRKQSALAKFREDRLKRSTGDDVNLLEENVKDEEDVYDIVDEEEYKSLVESRRQREDFVVDDGE